MTLLFQVRYYGNTRHSRYSQVQTHASTNKPGTGTVGMEFLLSGTTNGFRVPLRLTAGCGLRDSTLPNEDGGGRTNHG